MPDVTGDGQSPYAHARSLVLSEHSFARVNKEEVRLLTFNINGISGCL